ncbi:hypothetical protein GGS24DRAFT_462329 [Hypoxylon argillaceum]|nr:hypothetical protein GGS24DRAFT_462329 [Hypoxylon argillaceum]
MVCFVYIWVPLQPWEDVVIQQTQSKPNPKRSNPNSTSRSATHLLSHHPVQTVKTLAHHQITMPRFTIAEPHPTVGQNTYTHSGRGGAGNYFRAPETTPASGVATQPKVLPPSTSSFYSGRGGAGNARVSEKRPLMSFDEEFKLQSQMEEKRVGYVGRGGAGNIYDAAAPTPRRKDSDSLSASSVASSVVERVSSAFSRRRKASH